MYLFIYSFVYLFIHLLIIDYALHSSLQVSHKSLLSLAAVSQECSKRLELLKQWEADILSMIQLLTDTQRRLEAPGLTRAEMQQASIDAALDHAFSSRNSCVYDRLAVLVNTAKSLITKRENMAVSRRDGPEVELLMAHALLMRAFLEVWAVPFYSSHPSMLQPAPCMSHIMYAQNFRPHGITMLCL